MKLNEDAAYGSYSTPDDWGLKTIYTLHRQRPSYDWSVTGVFFDPETNAYHVSNDDGCSCYSEFDHHTEADFGPRLTVTEALAKISSTQADWDEEWARTEFPEKRLRALAAVQVFEYERIAKHL